MAEKRAFIFDLDGTVANTLTSIAYYGNEALKICGFRPIEEEKYKYMVGNGAKNLVRRMLHENGDDSEESYRRVFPLYNDAYDRNPLYLTVPYPNIPETLQKLKQRGMKLAVLSNKPHTTTCKVVEALFGNALFDLVYGQREGVPLKPDPTALLGVMDELGVKPAECVYVGDTATDMKTGVSAGAVTVGVLWGFRTEEELRENHADHIIAEAEELLQFVK